MAWIKTERGSLLNVDKVDTITWRQHWLFAPDPPGVVAYLPETASDVERTPLLVATVRSREEGQALIDAIAVWLARGAPGVFDVAAERR